MNLAPLSAHRRALSMGGAALVALIISVVGVMAFSRKPPPPPPLVATTAPVFIVRSANDLYTAETMLNAINLDRWRSDLKEVDSALAEMYKASASPTPTPKK